MIKRLFDVFASIFLLVVLAPVFFILAIAIKLDSAGSVFYRQERVTQYGRHFKIHKFRTMCEDADQKGRLVTTSSDDRITKIGAIIRKYRLDELPQLLDVLNGDMTFVGVRPEIQNFVNYYSSEMMATLLLPAGITNITSIYYKDENALLKNEVSANEVYINKILPDKMKWNLLALRDFSLLNDLKVMFMTLFAVCGKDYSKTDK